jgi:hypothetical protein
VCETLAPIVEYQIHGVRLPRDAGEHELLLVVTFERVGGERR